MVQAQKSGPPHRVQHVLGMLGYLTSIPVRNISETNWISDTPVWFIQLIHRYAERFLPDDSDGGQELSISISVAAMAMQRSSPVVPRVNSGV